MNSYDMTEDPNWLFLAHLSDLRHVGGTLLLRPLQLRLQVLLFSSQLQSTAEVQRYLWLGQDTK